MMTILRFAVKCAMDVLLTCNGVAAEKHTVLPLRPRKCGHAVLSGAV